MNCFLILNNRLENLGMKDITRIAPRFVYRIIFEIWWVNNDVRSVIIRQLKRISVRQSTFERRSHRPIIIDRLYFIRVPDTVEHSQKLKILSIINNILLN